MFRHISRLCVAVTVFFALDCTMQPPEPLRPAAAATIVVRPELNNPTIKRGSVGPLVSQAQRLLNERAVPICGRDKGCLDSYRIVVDGQFGPRTEHAVKMFQAQQDLEIDGIVGIDTWAELHDPTESCAVAKRAWTKYGGNASQANLAIAIAQRESGCRLQAINRNSRTRDNSHGPWQINYYGKLIARERTLAPIWVNHASWKSAISVVLIFVRTTGLCHWRTARC